MFFDVKLALTPPTIQKHFAASSHLFVQMSNPRYGPRCLGNLTRVSQEQRVVFFPARTLHLAA